MDRARAGRAGAPERSMDWWPRWSAGRCRALRHWARAAGVISCARRGVPRLKGASQAPWRLPPLHRLARFARDWQTSDALRRENAEVWLFESMDQKMTRGGAS